MRVACRGNLTVELIRQMRFDVAYRPAPCLEHADRYGCEGSAQHKRSPCRDDKVELSRQSLAYEPWSRSTDQSGQRAAVLRNATAPNSAPHSTRDSHQAADPEPRPITPVVGSPALAGLGVSLIVPGTLLDVVA